LKTPPRVLAILPGFVASTIMDVIKPLMELEREGSIQFVVTLEFYRNRNALKNTDLVVFCRNTDPRYRYNLDYVRLHNIPFIYDIDDNFFEIPLDTVSGKYHRDPRQIECLELYIKNAALVRFYSTEMVARLRNLGVEGELISPPLNWEMIAASEDSENSRPIKIVYPTSRKEDLLGEIFLDAVMAIQQTHRKYIELHFWGYLPRVIKNNKNVFFHSYIQDYARYLRVFSEYNFDIGLAPLLDDPFHRSKTNNKYREFGACGIAGIYSNVPVYSEFVKNFETGILVENTSDEWYKALVQLIEDHKLRQRIGQAARQDLLVRYPPRGFENVWAEQINLVLHNPEQLTSPHFQTAANPLPFTEGNHKSASHSVLKNLLNKSIKDWRTSLTTQIFNLAMMYKINIRKEI